MSHLIIGKDITELLNNAISYHLNLEIPDAVLGIETHAFDVVLEANSCEYSLDVGKDLYLNVGRWSRLVKEYLNKEHLERFIKLSKFIASGEARKGASTEMRFKDPIRSEKKHKLGGCLMGAVWRGSLKENNCTLIFYSRTTYLGYLAHLDAAIAHIIARKIVGKENLHKVKFKWYICSQQFHCFKSLPLLYTKPQIMKKLDEYSLSNNIDDLPPTIRDTVKWLKRIKRLYKEHGLKMLDIEKYGPMKRVERRWCQHMKYIKDYIPPSLPVNKLDFSKAQ
jgi:hypothetical protein